MAAPPPPPPPVPQYQALSRPKSSLLKVIGIVLVVITVGIVGLIAFLRIANELLKTDAQRFAEDYWHHRLTDCGAGSYLAYDPSPALLPGMTVVAITECKKPMIQTQGREMTEADRMNGLDWQGQTSVVCEAMRYRANQQRRFSAWLDQQVIARNAMWKRNGKWEVQSSGFNATKFVVHPDCSLLK